MSVTENLKFFNKNGYPYNFTYTNDIWNGKIFFDPNGSDTFENLSMYVLEKVEPIIYQDTITIVNSELYNNSGMTISPFTYKDVVVTSISPVNKSDKFFTKWIYGDSINKKFPKSTIISFNGSINGTNEGIYDFDETLLFTVLNVKRNAIMISTDTSNDLFDLTDATYELTVNSNRVFSFPEYNRDLNTMFTVSNSNVYVVDDYIDDYFVGSGNITLDGLKLSLIGTKKNDGVYEVGSIKYTHSSIYDYNMDSLSSGVMKLNIELLTERPLLYSGDINIYEDNDLIVDFINGKTSSLNIGDTFIVEDNNGEHLYGGNEYTIQSFLEEIRLGTNIIEINKKTEVDDDGKYNNYTVLTYDSNLFNINEQDVIYLNREIITENIKTIVDIYEVPLSQTSGVTLNDAVLDLSGYTGDIFGIYKVLTNYVSNDVESYLNGDILLSDKFTIYNTLSGGTHYTIIRYNPLDVTFNVDDIIYLKNNNVNNNQLRRRVSRITKNISGSTIYDALLDSNLDTDKSTYTITKVLKDNQKKLAYVQSTIPGSSTGDNTNIRCLSVSNIVSYSHVYDPTNINETLDTFISKYRGALLSNNIDIYRKGSILIIEGIYSGTNIYFKSTLNLDNTEILSDNTYSDNNNLTSVYNILLKDNDLSYERTNMSDELSVPFFADITLDLFDDIQDYGFNLTIDNSEYYIGFCNVYTGSTVGVTNGTSGTIESFIDKWYTLFYRNGLILTQGNDNDGTLNHLYINGQEPNVTVNSLTVRVNKNSTYSTNITNNKFIMVTCNYLESPTTNYINMGFTTGMIISVHGSNYPINNKEFNIIGVSDNMIELSYQGPMHNDTAYLYVSSREYLRRPRESNNKDIYYNFRWEDDSMDSIFMYDLSGDNLKPWMGNKIYEYNGPIPLPKNKDVIYLNKEPNKDVSYINIPSKQQTIFNELKFKLERFDDDKATILPKPISLFLGYNTTEEGVHNRKLILERYDNVVFSGTTSNDMYFSVSGNTILINNSNVNLLELGFEVGREIRFKFDDFNKYNKLLFEDWQDFIITEITTNKIVVNGTMSDFTTIDKSFGYVIEQLPETMATFNIYGETESEDERMKSNIKMLGINVSEEDEYIFSDSDIKEDGIDYRLLNRKRKEILNVYPEIYNYIGSYNAIFKSIYFFGYTDLELYEYYKNIDESSPLFNSFKKIVVPDLLNRDIEGWSYSEDLSKRIGYRKTNLLNLTYRITDEQGNNVNIYSLSDVQIKLNGLKNWLRKYIIPINTNIRDITGVSENTGTIWRRFDDVNIVRHKTTEKSDSINYNYVASKNFNDSWLVSVRFYNVDDFVPEYFDLKVITYVKDENNQLQPEQYYSVYKTDMLPFNFYMNWNNGISDRYMYVETSYYNKRGLGRKISKMYQLEDGITYYYDEFKNYVLVNNNFEYKYPLYTQDIINVYIIDDNGNIYVIKNNI